MLTEEEIFTILPQYSHEDIRNPDFEKIRYSCNDWQYYVPEYLQKLWRKLSIESQCIIYCMADQMAENAIEQMVTNEL